jgi:hypothetical protein
MSPEPYTSRSLLWRLALVVVGIVIYLFVLAAMTYMPWENEDIVYTHFPAIVGLPMAAALSFLLIILLPAAYGRIEFEALGIKLKGASGPIILWIICFIVVVVAIKLLW